MPLIGHANIQISWTYRQPSIVYQGSGDNLIKFCVKKNRENSDIIFIFTRKNLKLNCHPELFFVKNILRTSIYNIEQRPKRETFAAKMQSFYSTLYNLFLRCRAGLAGDKSYNISRQLRQEQWLPAREIRDLQLKRLRELLRHTYDYSTFYRKRFDNLGIKLDDINSLDDLSRIPPLTRTELQEQCQNIICTDTGECYRDSSGGSTGQPVNFFHDINYRIFSNAANLLFLNWMKIAPGLKTAAFWGADREFSELSFKERFWYRHTRVKILNFFNVSEESLLSFLDFLSKYKPAYIYGYASSLKMAADYINENPGRYKIKPRAIRSSAELLFNSPRSEIEKAFQAPVYNFYGSREVNNLASECSVHEGMHIFASGRIVEIVDKEGRPVPDGENGFIVVTDLTNFCFPFIRYLNGDMGVIDREMCSCGRGYPLLKEITGRASEIICINNKFIHGEFFTHLFYGNSEIRQFQVIQESDHNIRIRLVANGNKTDTAIIASKINEVADADIHIDIEFVDTIPPLKSGKYQLIINNTL